VALQADIGDRAQLPDLLARLSDSFGPPDIVINNAGVLVRGDLLDFDFSQQMEPMRRLNVDGLVAVTRAAAPVMIQRGWGRIVNLSSLAALGTSLPGTTFYAATKAAVIALTRRFALELGKHGITVNCIAPGFIITDMVAAGHNVDEMARRAMVGRTGKPEDIANAAAFLVSEESSFITAQTLVVDGGRMDYIGHA
jgi:3-oxoacyl-[acyl-carrier protein] reductase